MDKDCRPIGKWKVSMTSYRGKEKTGMDLKCTECGRRIHYIHLDWSEDGFDEGLAKFLMGYPYCHCGAKMEGVEGL